MYLLIFLNPFITILLLISFSNYLGYAYFSSVIIVSNIITLGIVFLLLYEVCYMGFTCTILIYSWCRVGQLDLKLELIFDPLSTFALFMIITISCLVYIYAIEYMYSDPHYMRFMLYLLSFSFFMIILVTSGNFVQLLLGWEGIGLLSYLLINFWTTRHEANRAAMKAMIINKVGDFALYLCIGLTYFVFRSLDFFVIFPIAPIAFINNNDIYIYICCLLILAAAGKSAQIGLHVWLADAMEGPTPVSALIHAATMVTAGIFLIIRCSPLLELSYISTSLILLIGSCTAFFSSLIGLSQYDIKKIIAYSTCSQLGYMVIGCGSSNYAYSTYHMLIHAFFKALLFLTAGALIYSFNGEQDLRKLGSSIVIQPFIYICFIIGSISLMGIPFFSGFYSKEIIIQASYLTLHISGLFAYFLSLLTIICTVGYSMKIFFFLNFNYYKNNIYFLTYSNMVKHLNEPRLLILVPLLLLSICSILSGFFLSDIFFGAGSDIFLNSICYNLKKDYVNFFIEFLPLYIKLVPLFVVISAYFMHFYYYNYIISIFTLLYWNDFTLYFKYKYYLDMAYSLLCEFFFFFAYDILLKIIEKTVFEFFGPLGVVKVIRIFFTKHDYISSSGLILANFLLLFIFLLSSITLVLYILFLASYSDVQFFLLSIIFFYYVKKQ